MDRRSTKMVGRSFQEGKTLASLLGLMGDTNATKNMKACLSYIKDTDMKMSK